MYAVIRIRGTVNIAPKISKTLELLGLKRVNNMSIWPENEQTYRMIKLVQDYVAFGKISDDVIKEVIAKKATPIEEGAKIDAKKVTEEIKKGKTITQAGVTNCFRLSPPRKGYERKGVKVPYVLGGANGDRKEEINELIMRMI
jgi:large subunit ribosomal protein L30